MPDNSPVAHRDRKRLQKKLQDGVVVACTTLMHPPARFGKRPRSVGLIELNDGTRIVAPLVAPVGIGTHVRSRMRLSTVNEEGLRIYDVAYEALATKPVETSHFPGYILALSGPSGVGKSTVSKLLLRMLSEYVESVPILTTKPRQAAEDGEERHVSKRVFTDLRSKGELVAMTHAADDAEEWYGYRAADISRIWKAGKLPVVVTETHLLQELSSHYGRRAILSCGLLPPGRSKRTMLSHLVRRLRQRGHASEELIRSLLKNAEKDIAFLKDRKDLFDRILVNDNLETVVATLRDDVSGLKRS